MTNNAHRSQNAVDVSILIVSYNTRELTLEAIRTAKAQTSRISSEIIVVDNASTDGSAEAIAAVFPDVRLMALDHNLGFAGGNNLASTEAKGEYLLLLNPDTVVLAAAIDNLVAFARANPKGRIWGGRTLFADGTLNPASCWGRMTMWNLACRATGLTSLFRNSEVFNSEAYGNWQRDTVRSVDIVSGCFLLIKRSFWRKLGGFAPVFFMYGEEADLCLRAKSLGARPMITPDAMIIHYGGASESARTDKLVRLLAAKAELIERHFSAPVRPFAHLLLQAWPISRVTALSLAATLTGATRSRQDAQVWRDVLGRRSNWRHGFTGRAQRQLMTGKLAISKASGQAAS